MGNAQEAMIARLSMPKKRKAKRSEAVRPVALPAPPRAALEAGKVKGTEIRRPEIDQRLLRKGTQVWALHRTERKERNRAKHG